MNVEPRQLVEVLCDLYHNTYLLWQPLVVALAVRLITGGLALSTESSWTHRFFATMNWVATWLLVGVILTVIFASVRY